MSFEAANKNHSRIAVIIFTQDEEKNRKRKSQNLQDEGNLKGTNKKKGQPRPPCPPAMNP